ncbi:hypothetical protein [Brevibacillus borstelensis]|uniref:TlpA family protein disulfide reductase n=1 Tax=Brevibacillus borstelensis TaxID=45462 RepID=UPI0030C296DB
MVYFLFGMIGCWSLLAIRMVDQIKQLKREVGFLPPESQMNRHSKGPSGANLSPRIVFPENRISEPSIVLVASPTCSECHNMVEEIVQTLPSLRIPYFALVDAAVEDYFRRFALDYAEYIEMMPVDAEQQELLGIESYPTLFIVDEQGIIRKRTYLLRAAIAIYNESFRKRTGAEES